MNPALKIGIRTFIRPTPDNSWVASAGGHFGPVKQEILLKSWRWRIDSGGMSTKNELIDVIDSARASGNCVKVIRRQKHAPNDFYMTLTQGNKQVGPVKVEGNIDELNRKFGEAQSYLVAMNNRMNPRATAA